MLKSWGDEGERKNQAVGDVIAEHCAKLAGAGHRALKLFKPNCCSLNEAPDILKVSSQGEVTAAQQLQSGCARCRVLHTGAASSPARTISVGVS